MKRAFFQVHFWLGLVLGGYFALLGLTGSLLIYGREIDLWLNPHLLRVERTGEPLPLSVVMQKLNAAYPKLKPSYINYPTAADGTYSARTPVNLAGQLYVYSNPFTGEVLGERTRAGHFYGFLCYLHFYLFFGQAGWNANGYGAIFLTVLLLTGVWLWWPARNAGALVWRSRLQVKTTAGRKKLLYDLHNVAGIYPLIFSLIFTLTTLEFVFPDATKRFVYAITGEVADTKLTVQPEGRQRLPLDELVAAADRAISGQIRRVSFPSTPTAPLQVRKEWEDWNVTRNHAQIQVDPYTGRILHIADTRQAGLGRKIIQWCIPLHFGIWGGMPVRVLYIVLGLMPLLAFVTGFWQWRLRVASRLREEARQRQRASVVLDTPTLSR